MAEGETRLRITTTAELLKAVELGIVDKTEARSLLGFGVKRGRMAKLQPRVGGRFTKGGDQVLPFNRFSTSARDAMLQAQELSGERGHPDTGDLLLALAGQAGSAAALALQAAGAGREQVSAALAGLARSEVPLAGLGPTAELKQAVEAAFHDVAYPAQVETRPLVLALAATEGVASAALAGLGVTPDALRAELGRLGGDPES